MEVNISELYPSKLKHVVYKHDPCGTAWIRREFSIRIPSFCSVCLCRVSEALASYSTPEEAEAHRMFIARRKEDERLQLNVARELNHEVERIESMKPKEKRYYKGFEVSPTFLDGSFYKKWLNWANVGWPDPDYFGCNKWKNQLQTKNFGPPISEKKSKWEVTTADLYQNISTWASK